MGKRLKENRTMSNWSIWSYGIGGGGIKFGILLVDFGMLFMTDYLGLKADIVAMLIAISKIFDAVTDVLGGTIIDRTRHKMGKARIWLLRMIPLMALTGIAFFFIPTGASEVVQYIYFFLSYTLFTCIFYTMWTVAHNTMSLYATGRPNERAFMSIATFAGQILLGAIVTGTYLTSVNAFGGGVNGWRMTSIVFAGIFAVTQLIYVFSIKEQNAPEETEQKEQTNVFKDLISNVKHLVSNRYFLLQLGVMPVSYTHLTLPTMAVV